MDGDNKLFKKTIKYFQRVPQDDEKSLEFVCLIENCNKVYCGKYESNIIKHVRRVHADFYSSNIEGKKEKLSLPQKRLKFIQNSVEIVANNGRSFKHLEDSGYKKMIEEKMDELVATGYGEGLNGPHFTAIKAQISYLADEIKKQITEDVKDKYVSLMIDFATKHHRSIMGVCLQYYSNAQIEIRSIGMLQMHCSSTSEHTLKVLFELLKSFGIEKSRVVSVTTDNAANLSLMVKMLNETVERENKNDENGANDMAQSRELDFEYSEMYDFSVADNSRDIDAEISNAIAACQSEDSDSDEELNALLNDDDDYISMVDALKNKFASSTLTVNGVKCAAHTLQLAVRDALKDKRLNIINLIALYRLVCKTLRKMKYQYTLKENGIEMIAPRLDCCTRWSSEYYMVRIHWTFRAFYEIFINSVHLFRTFLPLYLDFGFGKQLQGSMQVFC